MIDTIKTLKNLNKKFPRFQINTLLEILDCIEEKEELMVSAPWCTPTFSPSTVTCSNDTNLNAPEYTSISTSDNQMLFEPKKHHIKDKTSKNVRILTEEAPINDDNEMGDDELLYKETVDLLHNYLTKLDI